MAINYDRVRYEFAYRNPNAYDTLISEIRTVLDSGMNRKETVTRIYSLLDAMDEGKRIYTSQFNVKL